MLLFISEYDDNVVIDYGRPVQAINVKTDRVWQFEALATTIHSEPDIGIKTEPIFDHACQCL